MASQTQYAGAGSGWTNSGNITANDSSYAENTVAGLTWSDYLVATKFGFTIPPGSEITGVKISGEFVGNTGSSFREQYFMLHYAGAAIGVPDIINVTIADSIKTIGIGGDGSLWSWTPSISAINDSTFGMRMCMYNNVGTAQIIKCDYISMTVYYTPPKNTRRALLGVGA